MTTTTATTAGRGLLARALHEGPIAQEISAWFSEVSESMAIARLERQVNQLEGRAQKLSERAAQREALMARLAELNN